jgi:hypothetical protein
MVKRHFPRQRVVSYEARVLPHHLHAQQSADGL